MKNNTSDFVRLASRFTVLTIVALCAVNTFAQARRIEKPKAILIGEWSEPNDSTQSTLYPVRYPNPIRSLVRARVVNNSNPQPIEPKPAAISHALPSPTASAVATTAVAAKSYRYSGKFASLRPTALEEQAFALVNEERRKQNLSPVEWDLEMLYVARQHSQNMANLNFFSHSGRDGKTVDGRADGAGIKDWRSIGENIAFNQGIKNSIEFAVQCWFYSPSHKENMLSKKWTRSGVGVSVTPDGKYYLTQVFRN